MYVYKEEGHYQSHSVEDTLSLGRELGRQLYLGDLILLEGDLGAGKTHLTKGIAEGMGLSDSVTSPTFSLMQIYETSSEKNSRVLQHFDLYRIEKKEQLEDIDFKGMLEQDAVSVLEWALQFKSELPQEAFLLEVRTSQSDTTLRDMRLSVWSADGEAPVDSCLRARFQEIDTALKMAASLEGGASGFQGLAGAQQQESSRQVVTGAQQAKASSSSAGGAVADDLSAQGAYFPYWEEIIAQWEGASLGRFDISSKLEVYRDKLISAEAAGYTEAPGMRGNVAHNLRESQGYLLALDSSTTALALGLAELRYITDTQGQIRITHCKKLCAGALDAPRRANEEMVMASLSLLRVCGLSCKDLIGICVGRGPGSFTGVRIAVATAKGFAASLQVPLFGVSTLDAVAQQVATAGYQGELLVLDDAMRKELYPAYYQLQADRPERQGKIQQVRKVADYLEEVESLAKDCFDRTGKPLLLTGDIFHKNPEISQIKHTKTLEESLWHPRGDGLIAALRDCARDTSFVPHEYDPACVLPLYTRLSDAEEAERIKLGRAQDSKQLLCGVAEDLANRHLQINPMTLNDLPDVLGLEQRCFGDCAWSEQMFKDEFVNPLSRSWYVVRDQGQLIAYAGALYSFEVADLLKICVEPTHRRQGLAQKLLERIAYDMYQRACTHLMLEVRENNAPALRCYESFGFEFVKRMKDYYGAGTDGIAMSLKLPYTAADKPASTEQRSGFSREGTSGEGSLSESASSGTSFIETSAQSADELTLQDGSLTSAGQFMRSQHEQDILQKHAPIILALESSCDETAASLIDGRGSIVANIIASQIDYHARFGGVVPEIASRKHTEAIVGLVDEALAGAARSLGLSTPIKPWELSAVAVTQGPGLVGALVVGLAFAKGFAAAWDLPLIGVNHMEGHLYANRLIKPDIKPPFVASLLSGGHTMLVHVRRWGDYKILGQTLDDAVGEAFDKVSKALGLGYPGGPIISRLAKEGNPQAIDFPRALLHSHDYAFSLSGLKTAVINYIHKENSAGRAVNVPDLAASFEAAVIDVQVAKAKEAVQETSVREFCLGGGVAANPSLRRALQEGLEAEGVRVNLPPLSACTDNAAMIALVGLEHYRERRFLAWNADAKPNLSLEDKSDLAHP